MTNTIFKVVIISFFLSGCVAHVFHKPVTLSTKSIVARHATPIENVSCEYSQGFVVIVPIPADPRDVYDELLEEANAKGGNAVVDVQLRNKKFFLWVFPTIVSTTWEATGTASHIE
jgi:uncharacterized protein YbjQ (UPF0145 family)